MVLRNDVDMTPEGKFARSLKFLKTQYYKAYLSSVRKILEENSVKLYDFGITKEELEQIVHGSAVASAKQNVRSLKSGVSREPARTLKDLQQDIENGATLEEIGITEKEMLAFASPKEGA